MRRRELAASIEDPNRYRVYRVFDFARDRHLYVLSAPLADELTLEPKSWTAWPGTAISH